mgnify:CR=1 FL=1
MNEDVLRFLDKYKDDLDPQYAVLLDGKWGCGKTFFIKSWLDTFQTEDEDELTPMYVSLFGVQTVKQINDTINGLLFPFMNSKVYKIGKTFTKMVASAALRFNVDYDGDKKNDGTVDFKLDPLMDLLNDKKEELKGRRILIFDDLERANIGVKELYGYINRFVEHNRFKVIVVCNSTEITDKETFNRFREKVIGRTFEIHSDVDAAITSFANEIPTSYFVQQHISAIKEAFKLTGYSNLRVLRQCIRDFNQIFQGIHIDNPYQNKQLFHFLIRFVVLYSEMSTSNKDIIANWRQKYAQSLASDRPEMVELKRRISAIQQKYQPLEIKYGMNIFREINDITLIPDYCLKGIDLAGYLDVKLVPTERESWDCLYQYYDMNNEDFERLYAMTESAVMDGNFRNYQDYLKAISILIELSDLGIKEMNSKVFNTSKAYVENLIADISSSDSFADIKSNIINLLSNINQASDNNELRKKFNSSLNEMFATKLTELEHHYTEILENLSDDNLLELVDSMDKMLPDRSNSYQSYPIFKDANPELIAKRIVSLSNASKFHFYRFLNRRYGADTGHFISRELTPDMSVLNEIGRKLSEVVETLTLIDKYAVSSLVELIKKIDAMERNDI